MTSATCNDCTRPIYGRDGVEIDGKPYHASCAERIDPPAPRRGDGPRPVCCGCGGPVPWLTPLCEECMG